VPPIGGRQLGTTVSFVPALLSVVAGFDTMSAYLLVGDYRDRGELRLLVMACAYWWLLTILAGYALALPGIVSRTPRWRWSFSGRLLLPPMAQRVPHPANAAELPPACGSGPPGSLAHPLDQADTPWHKEGKGHNHYRRYCRRRHRGGRKPGHPVPRTTFGHPTLPRSHVAGRRPPLRPRRSCSWEAPISPRPSGLR
jgi:hypothetical protein